MGVFFVVLQTTSNPSVLPLSNGPVVAVEQWLQALWSWFTAQPEPELDLFRTAPLVWSTLEGEAPHCWEHAPARPSYQHSDL